MRKDSIRLKQVAGVGISKQICDHLYYAFVLKLNPEYYYKYELYYKSQHAYAKYYILNHISSALFALINEYSDDSHVEDKHRFSEMLVRFGYPTVTTLAMIENGRRVDVDCEHLGVPAADFIVKPNAGVQGQGVLRFERLSNDEYRGSDRIKYSTQTLEDQLVKLSYSECQLIQPRLFNHPSIADLTNQGLSTTRVISAISVSGETEVISAAFKMPVGDGVADNFAAGGVAAPVKLETGILGQAVAKRNLSPSLTHHPDTGGTIEGRQLPFWKEIIELVKDVHKNVLPEFVFLGWDIAITDQGVNILEVNVMWDVSLIQRPHRYPLGLTRFSGIAEEWLNHLGVVKNIAQT